MNRILTIVFCFIFLPVRTQGQVNASPSIGSQSSDLGHEYIEAWKNFYPSKAVGQGMHMAIFDYENRNEENISAWISFNKKMVQLLSDKSQTYVQHHPINTRLLKTQIATELDQWEEKKVHQNSLTLYSNLISKAMEKVLEADYLIANEKAELLCLRFSSMEQLAKAAQASLIAGHEDELKRGVKQLNGLLSSFTTMLKTDQKEWSKIPSCPFAQNGVEAILSLITHVEQKLLPNAKPSQLVLGKTAYTKQLKRYTDSELTPDQLSKIALEEIQTVRKLIMEVSSEYLKKQYPNNTLPNTSEAIIKKAFTDMEADTPKDGADYLQFWEGLSEQAIQFIEEKEIATLPELQTLRIINAPESAGPAARIGWVDSAPPFDPNPVTTLYLPSIPKSLPEQEKKDFWSSFNKPFNRMIVIHELFPGHYMQIKMSRETPHPVRLLFPYAVYFEGWATFAERVCLDAGWEEENPLTFLAHLRKRIENANRAYTSVQVHCNGWTQKQVMKFSTETSLLAPQFAKSLWGRIMRSPMQLTSYFLGGRQFTELLKKEKQRLGDDFNLKYFMDTIMKVGPVPIDEFEKIFENGG